MTGLGAALRVGDAVAGGRFVVEAKLGEGGAATVYRVRDVHGRRFALKVAVAPSAQLAARFRLEGRIQATLVHDHVVAVHEVIDLPGMLGMTLDLVEGPSLEQLLARAGRLDTAQADDLAAGLFRGLAAAHERAFVHRDLKPANVLLDVRAGRPVPRITDFGIAKFTDGDSIGQSVTGMFVGTAAYMAPEQARDGKHVDARADVFALGAVLYRMVTGRDAFVGRGIWELFEAVQAGRYPPPASLVPDLPARHVAAIDAALQPDPTARAASVAALADLWFGRVDALTWADPRPAAWPADWLARADTSEAAPPSVPTGPSPFRAPPPSRPSLPKGVLPAAIVALVLAAVAFLLGR